MATRKKTLYLIGGTMGVGKSTVCRELKGRLSDCVFLDGDWCWDADPFLVTEETKKMVIDNICYLLNNFIHCTAYQHVVFGWVMHEQNIIDTILERLDTSHCEVKLISLMADEECLRERINRDVQNGQRKPDVFGRSVARLPLYRELNTVKIDTSHKTVPEIAEEIEALG